MNLEQLFPEMPTFSLSSTGKTYHLRIMTLADRARFIEWSNGKEAGFGDALREVNWSLLKRYIYRLLVEKEDFPATTESFIDDDGVTRNSVVSGPDKLLAAIAGNSKESTEVFIALATALTRGEPVAESALTEATDTEKKKQKKSTGATSATSSVANTVIHQQSLVG